MKLMYSFFEQTMFFGKAIDEFINFLILLIFISYSSHISIRIIVHLILDET